MNFYKLIFVFSLIRFIQSATDYGDDKRLSIIHPPTLKKQQPNANIQLTSFSQKAKNLNLYGNLLLAQPFDACQDLVNKIPIQILQRPFFILANGTNCPHRKKARHAKKIGAGAIIILNNTLNKINQNYTKFKDGQLFSFQISDQEGTKIKTYMVNNQLSEIYVEIVYKIKAVIEKSKVQLWISALNEPSYQLLKIWNQTINQIPIFNEKIQWKPSFVVWNAKANPGDKNKLSCHCGGQFCSPQQISRENPVPIQQDFRQKQIFQNYNDRFMPYVEGIHANCMEKFQKDRNIQKCSVNVARGIGLDMITVNQKAQQAYRTCNNQLYVSMLLDRQRYQLIDEYPTLTLNRQIIKFSNKLDLQLTICKKLLLQQEAGCKQAKQLQYIKANNPWYFYFLLILGIILSGVLVFWCYRRKIKRQMDKQIKMQVNTAIEHYFSLTETKS